VLDNEIKTATFQLTMATNYNTFALQQILQISMDKIILLTNFVSFITYFKLVQTITQNVETYRNVCD